MSVSAINYGIIQWFVAAINKLLLQSECGLILQVTVDSANNVVGAEIVPTQVALEHGFEPVRVLK